MSNVEKTKQMWDKAFADDAPEVKDGEYDAVEPFDAVPWESIDWAGIVGDVRTMRRYGWLYSDARQSIVNRFEREFERRLNRQLQGIDKPQQ
jgi:hypothetical protein